jgi:hypothetical protein
LLDASVVVLGLNSLALATSDDVSYQQQEQTAEVLLLVGTVVYGAGAPTVHLAHLRPWQALSSLGLRVALPAIGAGAGLSVAGCAGHYVDCGLGEAIIGTATGALVAMVLDASLLAWESPKKNSEASETRLGLTPVVSSDGRRELRVFGTF